MYGYSAAHNNRTTQQIYAMVYSFCSDKMRPDTTITRTPRRCHQHRWIHLLVAIFIGLVAVDTCDAANNILQPTNDVMLSHGQRNNDSYVHLSDGKILKRDKRFLLFTGGGISKVVLGFLAPVETRDRVNWRTLNLAYNFQAQYVPIPSVIYLWDRFSRSLIDQRRRYDADGTFTKDLTRSLVYAALEMFLDRKGKPGRQCLLKAMCEAAEHPIERINVFDEIAHLVLTPSEDEIDLEYTQAKHAGEFGANCTQLYSECQPGDGLLDNVWKIM